MWPGVPGNQSEHTQRAGTKGWRYRQHVGITTGVTELFPRGVDGDQAGYDGVRPATHLGPGGAEECLRGNDDGV